MSNFRAIAARLAQHHCYTALRSGHSRIKRTTAAVQMPCLCISKGPKDPSQQQNQFPNLPPVNTAQGAAHCDTDCAESDLLLHPTGAAVAPFGANGGGGRGGGGDSLVGAGGYGGRGGPGGFGIVVRRQSPCSSSMHIKGVTCKSNATATKHVFVLSEMESGLREQHKSKGQWTGPRAEAEASVCMRHGLRVMSRTSSVTM